MSTTTSMKQLMQRAIAALVLSIASLAVSAVPLLDGNEDFKLMASEGFTKAIDGPHADGSPENDYAWSMAWFKGKLYVGTGRFETSDSQPVPSAGQLWVYTPAGADGASGTWAVAYTSPQFLSLPREVGYRWMTQCNFRGQDYLFISTLGPLQGNILYTSDGVTFNTVSRTGVPFQSIGFRTMVCFTEASGRQVLVTSPVGTLNGPNGVDSDRSDNPIVLANPDPTGTGTWQNYSPMGMGDANTLSLFAIHGYNGWLYAGTMNEVSGAQVWKSRGCLYLKGTCAPTWTKVIDRGGGRSPTAAGIVGNMGVSDLMGFNNSIYVAVSEPALNGNRIRAEMLRLRSDDTFEVLIGEPRMDMGTNPLLPSNLRCALPLEDLNGSGGANDCPPTTRRGAGYGDVGSAATGYAQGRQLYFWRLFVYANTPATPKGDNRLYTGTLGNGFRILATDSGNDWSTITTDGLGYPQQQGMRSIAASPYGLWVGGTHFATGLEGEIRGCNVYLGSPLADTLAPSTVIDSPPSPLEGAALAGRDVTLSWTSTDPAPASLPLTYAYRLAPLEASFSAFGSATTKSYTTLPNGTYTFYVIARDNQGNVEAAGAAGAPNTRTFLVTAPDLPPTVTINVSPSSPNTTGSAFFSWTGSDDVTPAASLTYDRWLSPVTGDPGTFASGTSATFGNLVDGTYTFHVVPKDGAGNVGVEAQATFTVALPPGPPGVPSPASASVVSPRTVRVTWANVSGETSYVLQRCQSLKGCAYVTLAPSIAANVTQYDDFVPAGLGSPTLGYRVQACNSSGCSAYATTSLVVVP